MTFKERIEKINHEESFDKACGMLEMLNDFMGTKYSMLNGRVTFKDDSGFHDLWAYL